MKLIRIILLASIIFHVGSCVLSPLAKAVGYHNEGDYEQAIKSFSNLLSDENFTSKISKYLIYNYRGISYYKNGQYNQAIDDYNAAISLKTDDAPAYFNRGLAYQKTHLYDLALVDIEKAIALNPEFFRAYAIRGEIYEMKGQDSRAIADYDKAIALEPNFVEAYFIRGNFYWNIKQYDLAIANYDTAIVLNPNQTQVYANRGFAFFYSGRYIEAAEDFEKIAQHEHKFTALHAMLWYYLAVERQGKNGSAALKEKSRYFELQQWPGALVSLYLGEISPDEVLKNTIAKDKEMENQFKCIAYFHVGQYFLLQGKKTLAIDMFQKAASFKNSFFNELAGANEELVRLHQMPI